MDCFKGDEAMKEEHKETVTIHATDSDGGIYVTRHQADGDHRDVFERVKDGEPLYNETVQLRESSELPPNTYYSETIFKPTHSGPAQVSTDEYRHNWDTIFGKNRESKELN
jgi:hypothetical protein